jgi:dTDP-4-dehydrorhamnose 3,5-epimerase
LEEGSVVSYLCSEEYNPKTERQINPLDKGLAIDFAGFGYNFGVEDFLLSEQDRKAQAFQVAVESGLLPSD